MGSLKCKDCKVWLDPFGTKPDAEPIPTVSSAPTTGWGADVNLLAQATLGDLVLAQNRTTHAVRSLAVFFFTSLCTSLLGYGIVGAGSGSPISCAVDHTNCGEPGFVIFGWFVIAVGFFVALGVGVSELNKSRIN